MSATLGHIWSDRAGRVFVSLEGDTATVHFMAPEPVSARAFHSEREFVVVQAGGLEVYLPSEVCDTIAKARQDRVLNRAARGFALRGRPMPRRSLHVVEDRELVAELRSE